MKKYFFIAALVNSAALFAQDSSTPPGQNLTQTLILIAVAILFFYVILWRPEQKRRKSLEKLRSSMKKGDKVTAMGIIGIVSKVEENTVIVKMVDGNKIEFLKAAISEVVPGEEKPEELKK